MSEPKSVTLKQFFEAVPPGEAVQLSEAPTAGYMPGGTKYWEYELPALQLHCDSDACQGVRFFDTSAKPRLDAGKITNHYAIYFCRNCSATAKTYSFRAGLQRDERTIEVQKYGEIPQYGPPTPARLITLIGPEREYFLKGRRAENQGLGIAAFAYYRRVVENQRNRIFDELIRVATKLNAAPEMLHDLEAAKRETQFSRAVASVKHGIPESLLIDGHNPLLLLHAALSEGLHAQTDQDCLEVATSIRVVLADLVQRIALALREEAELKVAVSRLLALKSSATGREADQQAPQ
jgi:hypothetical protein